LLAHCHGGCSYDAVETALVEFGLLDSDDSNLGVAPPITVRPPDDLERIAYAQGLYARGLEDDPHVTAYLHGRGITLPAPRALRFCEDYPHRSGIRLPAMLAPIVNVDGEQTGVHATYLRVRKDGSVTKADLPKDFQRQCNGVIRGGAIRLITHNLSVELLIAEGIETALSAAKIFRLPAWAAGSAGGLKTIELPREVRRIIIAADRDASGAGQRNALATYRRLIAEGRETQIKGPATIGDFNDELRRAHVD
jgi:hypothetical protein